MASHRVGYYPLWLLKNYSEAVILEGNQAVSIYGGLLDAGQLRVFIWVSVGEWYDSL